MKKIVLLLVVGVLLSFNLGSAVFYRGYLDEMGDADHFTIYLSSDDVDVEFGYPGSAEYWVLVLGETGKKLGYFNLDEGEVINLTGGGYFTLVIISHYGHGKWTAEYED